MFKSEKELQKLNKNELIIEIIILQTFLYYFLNIKRKEDL